MTSIIKVNNLQNQCGANTINKCGTAITVGASGDTINLASGASQSGFGRTGTVDWITTPKTTGTFTAVSGEGYFLNTSGGVITANLPAGTAGDIVAFADYAATWQTNAVTVSPNGTEKIGSVNADVALNTEGQSVTFVYVDSTQGWINTMDSTSNVRGATFITATGGTPSQDGDYEIRTFTGPGTFCVSALSNNPANNVVDYLVVAGGASGGKGNAAGAGGGGAGGLRVSPGTSTGCWTASPLGASPAAALPVAATGYPITVGGGGAGMPCNGDNGNSGNISTFSSITSAGGGGGSGACLPAAAAGAGGSGGGGMPVEAPGRPAGVGNTPSVSPPQGNPGGTGTPIAGTGYPSGGGGGAIASGQNGLIPNCNTGGAGGAGAQVNICGNNYFWAGGGGGTAWTGYGGGAGGSGGGGGGGGKTAGGTGSTTGINNGVNGSGIPVMNGGAGGANTGGGGGGANSPGTSGAGGSGIVIIRYKFQ